MAPKHSSTGTTNARPRGGATSSSRAQRATQSSSRTQNFSSPQIIPSDRSDDDQPRRRKRDEMDIGEKRRAEDVEDDDDDDVDEQKTIPADLLTRILHEFFEKDGTRISKDANKAVAKYMDIFVREAIARTAVEKGSGFLEVADLEKIAPQLLMDL